MSKRILLVEDDTSLARVLADNLIFEGFIVDWASSGPQALQKAQTARPDLVLLDLMLPGLDGFDVCKSLTSAKERLPIIMLSARTQQEDKILGLKLGADDYVTKPFALAELLARIHSVLRRSQTHIPVLTLGDVVVDFERMQATRGRELLSLSSREFAVLQYLAERQGTTVTRDVLLRDVWGYSSNNVPLTRSVDILIARLRRKIEPDPRNPRFLRTIFGDGYSLTHNKVLQE